MAGYTPNTIPHNKETTMVNRIVNGEITISIGNTHFASRTILKVTNIPIAQPISEIKEDSNKNSKMI